MAIRGIVFDLDGVLLDTEGIQWEGWNVALKPFGITIDKEEYLEYAGKQGRIIEEQIISRHGLDIQAGELLHTKEKWLMELFSSKPIAFMPDAVETIQFFRQRGFALALASGGSRQEVELKLNQAGLSRFFPIIVSTSEVSNGKPAPDIYLLATKRLGLHPSECLAFEDTQFGVASAKKAGLHCVAVYHDLTKNQDFSSAEIIVPNLKQGIERIQKIFGIW